MVSFRQESEVFGDKYAVLVKIPELLELKITIITKWVSGGKCILLYSVLMAQSVSLLKRVVKEIDKNVFVIIM